MIVNVRQATKKGYIECDTEIGGLFDSSYPTSKIRRGRVQGGGGISPALLTGSSAILRIEEINMGKLKKEYRIRKITPRECGRLMNVGETAIDKMLETESNSQCYKAFGNSIVVACLCAIFSQMNIKGVKKWNDMTEDERYKLIYKGCHIN